MTDQRTAAWIGRRPIVECLEPRTHPDAAPAAVESFTNPVLNRDFPDPGAVDPSVFTAENGVQYLLWKNDGNAVGQDTNIYLQELSTDGLSLVGAAAALIKQDKAWEGSVVEGPVLWTHGGKFYLFYCANNFASSAYATGYAESDFLRGPYTKPGGPLVTSQGYVVGPGGPEIVVGPDGNDWMLYHAW